MERDAEIYLAKAAESLLTAESEFDHGRYNSCANRCYYACFQAAITAMLREGIRPPARERWGHEFVHAQFVGLLINRRKRYDAALRSVIAENQRLREIADYRPEFITRTEARQALVRSRTFVAAVQARGDGAR